MQKGKKVKIKLSRCDGGRRARSERAEYRGIKIKGIKALLSARLGTEPRNNDAASRVESSRAERGLQMRIINSFSESTEKQRETQRSGNWCGMARARIPWRRAISIEAEAPMFRRVYSLMRKQPRYNTLYLNTSRAAAPTPQSLLNMVNMVNMLGDFVSAMPVEQHAQK